MMPHGVRRHPADPAVAVVERVDVIETVMCRGRGKDPGYLPVQPEAAVEMRHENRHHVMRRRNVVTDLDIALPPFADVDAHHLSGMTEGQRNRIVKPSPSLWVAGQLHLCSAEKSARHDAALKWKHGPQPVFRYGALSSLLTKRQRVNDTTSIEYKCSGSEIAVQRQQCRGAGEGFGSVAVQKSRSTALRCDVLPERVPAEGLLILRDGDQRAAAIIRICMLTGARVSCARACVARPRTGTEIVQGFLTCKGAAGRHPARSFRK